MLTGEYKHTFDAKFRLFIPAKHREELGSSFMIVRDIRGPRLKVFSMEQWENYIAPIRKESRKVQDKAMRWFNQASVDATPDAQGRVGINSPLLLDHAKFIVYNSDTDKIEDVLSRDAVVVGCGDYAEIWEASEYKVAMAAVDADELLAELEELGL